ncbi:hypothetical protein PHYPSEUDO_012632 [Phytophthora pseudosyringae]|uniref:CWH43-like N-terminal domain-containing protein n=1 Tax=Phytophthora pseudosyringae TaxID=221518 RepID=A0A8T1V6F3_9STRA|nr:hypothetical protein PHYPSEUDO_012632 [Phytophthora pseudosyringae]
MAEVRPIPFQHRTPDEQLRNPLRPDLTWHRKLADSDDDDDADAESSIASNSDSNVSSSSSEASSEASSSSASSVHESDSDADPDSEQEEEDAGGRYSSDDDALRPPESTFAAQTLTAGLLDALGDMARTDNLGYIAWLVPITGICTMLGTELLACANHFTCSENFPTLSYAATFKPEGYVFTGGMCLTAVFVFASVVLFFWYVRLRTRPQREVEEDTASRAKQLAAGYACLVFGVMSAISLFGLAVMDMRTHHEAHINFTIAFFISAWVMLIAVQTARKSLLHEDEGAADDGKASAGASLLVVLRRRSFWLSLRRWRRLDFHTAYTLARLLLNTGLASTFLFGLFFLCANGMWPNPLGFTAVQEAFFEALAIVCQLLFMGTFSCELARLARLVEHSDYAELERSE